MNRTIAILTLAALATVALSQTIRPRERGRTTDARVMGARHYTCWHASQLPGLRLRKKFLIVHTTPALWAEAPTLENPHGKLRRIFRRLYNRDVTNSLTRIRTTVNDPRVRLRPTNNPRGELIRLGEIFDTQNSSTTTTATGISHR